MTWQPELYRRRVPVKNNAAVTAPGYALMAIVRGTPSSVQDGETVWNVQVADATDEADQDIARLLVNGPVPIPAGGYGTAFADWPSKVLHDSTDSLSFGDSLGCKSGSWYAWTDYNAGVYLGADPTESAKDQDGAGIETVWMGAAASLGIKPLIRFTLGGALTINDASVSGTAQSHYGQGVDGPTSVTLYNLETASAGTYVFAGDSGDAGWAIFDQGSSYMIIQLECD